MTKQERLLLACAMMRKLWQIWDARGESLRSCRCVLLEYALWLAPDDLPHIDDASDKYFKELVLQLAEDPQEPGTEPLAEHLCDAPYPVFCVLVLGALTTLCNKKQLQTMSMTERNLIAHAFVLLAPWRAPKNAKYGIKNGAIFMVRPSGRYRYGQLSG